jgi:hypothetical protein
LPYLRYGHPKLVGLAGENDLDAPDLITANAREVAGNGPNPETPLRGKPDIDFERSSPHRWRKMVRAMPRRRSGDPGDLASIADADALFRWALEILPARNKLDDAQRAAFDAAFLARADAIGADPDLLIPFTSRRAPSPLGDGPVAGHIKNWR